MKAINNVWSVAVSEEKWTYFQGVFPVFGHRSDDGRSFRMFTAQLICLGGCKQADIVRAFGVSRTSVSRSVAKFEEGGHEAFFKPRRGRGGSVITEEVRQRIEERFEQGQGPHEVAKALGIKYDTLRKAIAQERVARPFRPSERVDASDKSTRAQEDAQAEIGMACTRPLDRVAAALGQLPGGAQAQFEPCHDVTFGGMLCALPALVANGLLRHVGSSLRQLTGYYTTLQVLLLLAYMALGRIKTIEQLQYHSPGELGKLMGLDRVPEVRCLRNKLAALSEDEAPEKWSRVLSQEWMEASPELAGVLYVDGHVRVYHGGKTALPKRFVSRERLCLRGTTDYWVNDALGQPFFFVSRPVDKGMLEALDTDIVPRLLEDVPGQPSAEELEADPDRERFTIVFDREGYSPAFFKKMWEEHRIACITYHKFPKDDWSEELFVETVIEMPSGERLTMKLAEMASWVGDKKNGLWVREVRKLCKDGHQTTLISSARGSCGRRDAALIFSRWSQENFFAYMENHYAIDLLSEHGTVEIPGTLKVVNPAWRELERLRRRLTSKLNTRRAKFANLELHPELGNTKKIEVWQTKKAEIVEEIERLEHDLEETKLQIKESPKHICAENLPAEHAFQQLRPSRKLLMDTVKMIAYRAETAMVGIVREQLARKDDARALIRDLCTAEADILPDRVSNSLTIKIHSMASARHNRAVCHLLQTLNDARVNYPGTSVTLQYQVAAHCSSQTRTPNSRP
jgi:transposase